MATTLIPPTRDEATVTPPARSTHCASELAGQLFDEEVAILDAQATVKAFIGVIATRRVRQRLKELDKADLAQAQFDRVDA
jgi:Protein of unknown function (DUF3562)